MRHATIVVLGGLVLALAAGSGLAADEVKLKKGDAAPVFQSTDDHGKRWKSADHVGKKILVVYFYPADFTGGCTKQACGFRDDMKALKGKGVEVIGVSGDEAKTHELFKKHHKLPFTLLADVDGSVAKKFGVPTSKGDVLKPGGLNITGQELTRGVTIKRWTFVIDRDGKIAHVDDAVKAAEDSKTIQKVVEALATN